MKSRRARDDEVAAWKRDGWVLLDGLIGPGAIDRAVEDLHRIFPTAQEYHADPAGVTARYLGTPPPGPKERWPEDGPGFRPEQHRWSREFPFPGTALNRLCVHASI